MSGPLERLAERAAQAQAKRRADVTHVQQHHPELAAWLTEMAKAFGRGQVDYRATLREVKE